MEFEAQPEEVIWQSALKGHLMWVEEISSRLSVRIEIDHPGDGHAFLYGKIHGANAVAASAELAQAEDCLAQLFYSLLLLQGDPLRRGIQYRMSADLYGRTPQKAIVESGLICIDVVLLGPDTPAAEILANDSRLYAAAKTRALYAHELDGWNSRVRHLIAFADSILARRAIDEMLEQQR